MKRDIDLCRQLLLDIESRGVDCSLSVVRTAAEHDPEPRVKHHLRLLVDAGYLKEIERTTEGVPCVRLTDAGHELIELVRSEPRWHEAKRVCRELTGGASVTVVREILLQWALAPVRHRGRRPYYAAAPDAPPRHEYRPHSGYRLEPPYRDEAWEYAPEEVRYVRLRPSERHGWREAVGYTTPELAAVAGAPSLPDYLI